MFSMDHSRSIQVCLTQPYLNQGPTCSNACLSHVVHATLQYSVQALEDRERDEVEWGEVLHAAHSGLTASRRLLWDEAERKIIALLSSSSAFEGDHFLQVGCPCAAMCDITGFEMSDSFKMERMTVAGPMHCLHS